MLPSEEMPPVHVILSGLMAPGSLVVCARGRRPLPVGGYDRNTRAAGRAPVVRAILGEMPFVHVADVDELAPATAVVIRPARHAQIAPARGNWHAFDVQVDGVRGPRVLGPFDTRQDALAAAGVAEAVYRWQAAVQGRLAAWGAETLSVADQLVRGGLYAPEDELRQAAVALIG